MAKKKITRKALLKEPDEFLTFSNRAAIYISEHTQQLKYLGTGVAVCVLLYLAVTSYLGYVDRKGQEAYSRAYEAMSKSWGMNPEPKTRDRWWISLKR